MNSAWNLGHWAVSEQWNCWIQLRYTLLGGIGTALSLTAAGFFLASYRRNEGAPPDRLRLFFFGLSVLALVLVHFAGDAISFYIGWCLIVFSSIFLGPRDSHSDGTPLSAYRWAPGQASEGALLLTVVLVQGLLRTTEWGEMARISRELSDFSQGRALLALTSAALAAWGLFFFFPAHRKDLATPCQAWCRNAVSPLAAIALLSRVNFLALLLPHATTLLSLALCLVGALACLLPLLRPAHPQSWTLFGIGFGANICAAALWLTPDLAVTTADPLLFAAFFGTLLCVVGAAYRLGPAAWGWEPSEEASSQSQQTAFTRFSVQLFGKLNHFDTHFWKGIWEVPAQCCRSLGSGIVYWQGRTAQYILVVILVGTLVLFWAALKTQVIW